MYKFKIKSVYNKKTLFCIKTEFQLKFEIKLQFYSTLAKLDIVRSTPVSNSLIFSDDIPGDLRFVTFSLLSNIREIRIRAKTRKF